MQRGFFLFSFCLFQLFSWVSVNGARATREVSTHDYRYICWCFIQWLLWFSFERSFTKFLIIDWKLSKCSVYVTDIGRKLYILRKKKLFKARRLISTHAFILIFGCKNTTIDKEECIAKTVSNPISTRDSITNVSPRAYKRPAGWYWGLELIW